MLSDRLYSNITVTILVKSHTQGLEVLHASRENIVLVLETPMTDSEMVILHRDLQNVIKAKTVHKS